MAYRVNIEPEVWGDPNYEVVARVMGWTFPEFAIGFVAKLWAKSQHEGVTEATAEQLNEFIGLKLDEALWVKALLRGKIIEKVGPDRYKIRGNKDQIQGIVEYKKKKSEAGKKSAESRKAKFGSPVPVGGSNFPDNTEQNPNTNRTPVKQCSESVPEQNPNTAEPITITNTSNYYSPPAENNGSQGKKSSLSPPSSAENFEAQFNAGGLKQVAEVMSQAYGGEPPAHRLRLAPKILAYFKTPKDFAEWVEGVINGKNCPDPTEDKRGFDKYFWKSLHGVLRGVA